MFKILQGEFEGPIDLLLDLIEKRKMHISDVSLATVADDFITYVEGHENLPVGETAHFVYVAATLLLIKSKSLLPGIELNEEESASMQDLERRLKMYKLFKEQVPILRKQIDEGQIFAREESREMATVFAPSQDLSLTEVAESILRALKNIPIKEVLPKIIVDKVISLEEMMDDLAERMQKGIRMSFKSFAHSRNGGEVKRREIIVGFLAMLELVRRGIIEVSQHSHFEDIEMNAMEPSKLPNYG